VDLTESTEGSMVSTADSKESTEDLTASTVARMDCTVDWMANIVGNSASIEGLMESTVD
jgi:hypothetical protein